MRTAAFVCGYSFFQPLLELTDLQTEHQPVEASQRPSSIYTHTESPSSKGTDSTRSTPEVIRTILCREEAHTRQARSESPDPLHLMHEVPPAAIQRHPELRMAEAQRRQNQCGISWQW